jgi:predicted nucleic acid-binding protein
VTPLRWSAEPAAAAEVVGALRLCIDLNVWCAALLSENAGRTNTASQLLALTAARGVCALGATQMVISWAMLSRLEKVLVAGLEMDPTDARGYVEHIARIATAAPGGSAPYLVLGGTGMVPLHDEEDAGVLETAVAGRADILATGNFSDFLNYRTEIVKPGRIAIHRTSDHEVIIAHLAEAAAWIRTGEIVIQ